MDTAQGSAGPQAAAEPQEGSRVFMAVVYAAQFFFGGWFLYNGVNFFVEFFPQPPGSSALSYQLISALIDTGLFAVVKILEGIVGLMLLSNRFVPLAIVLAFPISVSVAHLNLVNVQDPLGIVTGVVIMALNGIMALGYLDKFLPMLTCNSGDPSLLGIRTLLRK